MRKLILFLLLCLLIKDGYSQNGWFAIPTPFTYIKDFQFLNSQTGYICGLTGNFAKTTNGGATWQVQSFTDGTYNFDCIDFLNEKTGWVSAHKYESIPIWPVYTVTYSTTNGGTNWTLVSQGNGDSYSADIKMLGKDSILFANTGFSMFSSLGSLTYTYNNGSSYQLGINEFTFQFSEFRFLNKNTGWVIALEDSDSGPYRNRIYKTTNSGLNWNYIYRDSINPKRLANVFFVNENTGYIAGENGRFAKTLNGGANWASYNISTNFPVNTIHFFDENTGYIASPNYNSSDSGCLKRTTDGGITWQNMRNIALEGIYKIYFLDNLTGWATGYGNGNGLMKTITGGLTSVNPIGNIIPEKFSLQQNYPNPFNPSTVISYQLPVAGNITLKIYDALGNEVQTLVNEKQNAGSYSFDFNAASLPSGIYFYKLVTEKFSETKKMILIK